MTVKHDEIAASDKFAYTILEAAALSSVGRSTLYRQMERGSFASIKIGKRRLITATALQAWLASAPAA
jgi:excisionase family DNA binding protein